MDGKAANRRYEIKKYPNRRYYDATAGRHVTLTDLYELVRTGNEIVVTDSKTGSDITNVVLTQIILEHDPPKLDLFPSSLLHQAIQANQQMVRKFVDQYFAQAVDAFSQSRRQFDEFLKRSGFSPMGPTAPFDWVRMLFPGGGPPGSNSPVASPADVRQEDASVSALREQVSALREELHGLRRGNKAGAMKAKGRRSGRK